MISGMCRNSAQGFHFRLLSKFLGSMSLRDLRCWEMVDCAKGMISVRSPVKQQDCSLRIFKICILTEYPKAFANWAI